MYIITLTKSQVGWWPCLVWVVWNLVKINSKDFKSIFFHRFVMNECESNSCASSSSSSVVVFFLPFIQTSISIIITILPLELKAGAYVYACVFLYIRVNYVYCLSWSSSSVCAFTLYCSSLHLNGNVFGIKMTLNYQFLSLFTLSLSISDGMNVKYHYYTGESSIHSKLFLSSHIVVFYTYKSIRTPV